MVHFENKSESDSDSDSYSDIDLEKCDSSPGNSSLFNQLNNQVLSVPVLQADIDRFVSPLIARLGNTSNMPGDDPHNVGNIGSQAQHDRTDTLFEASTNQQGSFDTTQGPSGAVHGEPTRRPSRPIGSDSMEMITHPVKAVLSRIIEDYHFKIRNNSLAELAVCVSRESINITELTKAIKAGLNMSAGGSVEISESIKQAFQNKVTYFPLHTKQKRIKVVSETGKPCDVSIILENKLDNKMFKYICQNFPVSTAGTLVIEQTDIDVIGIWITATAQANKNATTS